MNVISTLMNRKKLNNVWQTIENLATNQITLFKEKKTFHTLWQKKSIR